MNSLIKYILPNRYPKQEELKILSGLSECQKEVRKCLELRKDECDFDDDIIYSIALIMLKNDICPNNAYKIYIENKLKTIDEWVVVATPQNKINHTFGKEWVRIK